MQLSSVKIRSSFIWLQPIERQKDFENYSIFHIFRGDHIVPSFEEMFPGLRSGDNDPETTSRKKHIGDDYYNDAMQVKD